MPLLSMILTVAHLRPWILGDIDGSQSEVRRRRRPAERSVRFMRSAEVNCAGAKRRGLCRIGFAKMYTHRYIYTYVYVCLYVYMYVDIYVCMYTCTYNCGLRRISVRALCYRLGLYTDICMAHSVCVLRVCTSLDTYIYIRICIYIYRCT